jgi:hypothetical protein
MVIYLRRLVKGWRFLFKTKLSLSGNSGGVFQQDGDDLTLYGNINGRIATGP